MERDPVMGIRSLKGLVDDRTMDLLEAHAALAPKTVLAALTGVTVPHAHALRMRLARTGREVIDSLGLAADPPAMKLRWEHVETWPSSVFGSTLGLADTPEITDLRARCQEIGSADLHLLRRVEAARTWHLRPPWALKIGEQLP